MAVGSQSRGSPSLLTSFPGVDPEFSGTAWQVRLHFLNLHDRRFLIIIPLRFAKRHPLALPVQSQDIPAAGQAANFTHGNR
jgi:hypothetical protein